VVELVTGPEHFPDTKPHGCVGTTPRTAKRFEPYRSPNAMFLQSRAIAVESGLRPMNGIHSPRRAEKSAKKTMSRAPSTNLDNPNADNKMQRADQRRSRRSTRRTYNRPHRTSEKKDELA
jgi:hypothetical protein